MLLYVIFHNYEILHILEILITSCEMQLENLLNGSDWSDLSLATLLRWKVINVFIGYIWTEK